METKFWRMLRVIYNGKVNLSWCLVKHMGLEDKRHLFFAGTVDFYSWGTQFESRTHGQS